MTSRSINDRYGHRAGDRVLQKVANSFVSGLRAEDFIARIGGEEFVMLIRNFGPEAAVRIWQTVYAPPSRRCDFIFAASPVRVTASCGSPGLGATMRRCGLRPRRCGSLSREARRKEYVSPPEPQALSAIDNRDLTYIFQRPRTDLSSGS